MRVIHKKNKRDTAIRPQFDNYKGKLYYQTKEAKDAADRVHYDIKKYWFNAYSLPNDPIEPNGDQHLHGYPNSNIFKIGNHINMKIFKLEAFSEDNNELDIQGEIVDFNFKESEGFLPSLFTIELKNKKENN